MDGRTVGDHLRTRTTSSERVRQLQEELTGDLLDADQVAILLDVERSTVLRYLRDGALFGFQLGRRWRIPASEVKAFIQRQVDREREARQIAHAEAEAKRKCQIRSETQSHWHYHVLRCHQCGHNTTVACDKRREEFAEYGKQVYIDRSGECEFCQTSIDEELYSHQELMREWAQWREPEIEAAIDRQVGWYAPSGERYHKNECVYCGSPVLVSGFAPAEGETPDPGARLTGTCQVCERTIQVDPSRQEVYEMPF